MKINYKSDFDFFLSLKDAGGKEIPFPDNDFVAKFYTSIKANAYTVSCIGGVCTNCFNDNGRIHVVVDNHNMGVGKLKVDFTAMLDNSLYPDGSKRIFSPIPLGIELVTGAGDYPTTAEVEASLPLIKGDKGERGDRGEKGEKGDGFTPAQIAKLDELPEAEALSARIDAAASASFIDLWDSAWGTFGKYDPANAPDAEHPYLGNGIWMTYEEAKEIMLYYTRRTLNSLYYAYMRSNTRTFIPPKIASTGVSMQLFCANSGRLEKVVFSENVVGSDMYAAFSGCRRLREIQGVIIAPYADYSAAFNYCERLEEVRIQKLGKSISFKDSSNLSLESISYMIENATNTAAITITLHPTAYARVTDELFALAAEKNITIAST